MIAFLARFIGLWLIAGALVALVVDGTKTIAASRLTVTPLGLAWYSLSPSSLMRTQEFVQREVEAYIGHWLWDPIVQWILMAPTWWCLGSSACGWSTLAVAGAITAPTHERSRKQVAPTGLVPRFRSS
jgi:hypothetical protein